MSEATHGHTHPPISVLLPSRGRPEIFKRMLLSLSETALGVVEVVLRLDDDDPCLDDYFDVAENALPKESQVGIVAGVAERDRTLSNYWNECYERARGTVLMHAGDDIVFRTPAWDATVLREFDSIPDKIAFVYGDDGVHPTTFGTHGFVHRRWVTTVGYFVPPYFTSDYNDTWLNDVAQRIGRHRHIGILTEHMHFTVGKAEIDQTTKDRLERHTPEVDALYVRLEAAREADAEKLRRVML